MSTSQTPKYDMRLNKPYQIDFQNTAAGKRVANTKRRVRFRFGFSNAEAISRGLSGTECRGEEHEVTVVWSLTSGKRLVLYDNEEVHFSVGNRTEGTFETTWSIVGGHIMKLIAHAAPPLFPTPGFRQFDLLLDGFSFFSMPFIFELGKGRRADVPRLPPSSSKPVSSNYGSSLSLPEEEAHPMQFAQPAAEPARCASAPTVTDFLEGTTTEDYLESSLAAKPSIDQFAPVASPSVDGQAPQPFASVANQVMSAYSSPPSTPTALDPLTPTNGPTGSTAVVVATPSSSCHPVQHSSYQQHPTLTTAYPQQAPQQQLHYQQPDAPYLGTASPEHQQPYSAPPPAQPAAVVTPEAVVASTTTTTTTAPSVRLTMESLDDVELESRDQQDLSDIERAMQSLVNFDDISEKKVTPQQLKTKKQKELRATTARSKPLAPTKADWSVGQNACLSDIRKHAQPKAVPQKEIMRTHAFDPAAAQAGMMVVYGSTPSFAGSGGFGAGMMQQYPGYYSQPQHHAAVMSRVY